MAFYHPLLSFFFLALILPIHSHNITAILDTFPEYSVYNTYLSKTKVCDEINSHERITCLVLPNKVMSSFVAKHSLAGIKNALRLFSLLDYIDPQKLQDLTRGITLTANLYQSTGNALGEQGYVRITNLRGSHVGFAFGRPGAALGPLYAKSVMQIPYNLSVLEISGPVNLHGLTVAPAAPYNLTDLLEKAGCTIFASLITSSSMLKVFQSAMEKGFTLFAPTDSAFKADGAPDLSNISRTDLVKVLQFHVLPSYTSETSLKTIKGPITTMASNGSANYNLSVMSHGGDIFLDTGVNTIRVISTVVDGMPICILTVERLLLPWELFSGSLLPVAGDHLGLAPTPAPVAEEQRHHRRHPPPAPRARSPPPPNHGSPPPPPNHDSPPPPEGDSPPLPPSPDLPAPSPDAPSPDNNDAAKKTVYAIVVSVCIIIIFFC